MKKTALFLLLTFIFYGCGGPGEPSWKAEGILKIGTDATYPPFETVNTASGQLEGFDIDVMKKICEINQWTSEFIVTPFDGIIAGLNGAKYDCIISAMSITPQREAVVDFSLNYYLAGQVIAVPTTDSVITGVENLTGRKVGVQLGTTGERMARSLPGVTVLSFDNIGSAFIDMENGQIDAVLNDFPTTAEYIRLKGRAKIVGARLSEEHYGIAVRKGENELLSLINAALLRMKNSGDFDKLQEKWFGLKAPQ